MKEKFLTLVSQIEDIRETEHVLLRQKYIKRTGMKDKIYIITNSGHVYADQVKEEFNIETNKESVA